MGGYNEIQNPPERYGLIDVPYLSELCGFSTPKHFAEQYRQWVQETIDTGQSQRESHWTQSIAVGSVGFVEEIKARLGIKGIGRKVERQEASRFVLREESEAYGPDFGPQNGRLSPNNSHFLNIFFEDSVG
jgi:putative transposase